MKGLEQRVVACGDQGGTESRSSLRADDPKAARLTGGDDLSTDKAYRAAMDDARQDRARAAAQSAKNRERKQKEEQLKEVKAYQVTYREAVKRQQAAVNKAYQDMRDAHNKLGSVSADGLAKAGIKAALSFFGPGKAISRVNKAMKSAGSTLGTDINIQGLHAEVDAARKAYAEAVSIRNSLQAEEDKYTEEVNRIQAELNAIGNPNEQ